MTAGYAVTQLKRTACVQHLFEATFGMSVGVDAILGGVATHRGHKIVTPSEVKCHYHDAGPLPSHCASASK